MSCTCNHFPSVPRLASTRRGSPTRYIYLVKLRDIWGITWKLCSIYLDKWKDGTMCSRNCIEVRLMEQEDVKQTQYWEFINGPTLSLSLYSINYFLPKNLSKRAKRQTWFVEIIWPKSDLRWEKGKKIIKSHWCGWQELWQGFWGEDLTTGGGEVGVGKTGTGEPIVLILIYEILLVNIKRGVWNKIGNKNHDQVKICYIGIWRENSVIF